MENGADLQHVLDGERERHRLTKSAPARDPALWVRHVTTWAKVLVAGIAALHESKIVHADLKPLLNGKTLSAPSALRSGDRIAVGRQDKGVIKLPLTARGR